MGAHSPQKAEKHVLWGAGSLDRQSENCHLLKARGELGASEFYLSLYSRENGDSEMLSYVAEQGFAPAT